MKFPTDEQFLRKLTPDEIRWLEDYFKKHWSTPLICPVEGHQDWEIGEHFVHSPIWTPEHGMYLGGRVYPNIMLLCRKCGYTMYFNAVVIGLLKKDGENP